jgi:anti-sigma factor RsiW
MDCTQSRTLMSAYLDNELDAAGALSIEQHMATCPACAAALAQMRGLGSAIREHAPAYSAPAHLRQSIRSAIRAAHGAKPAPPRKRAWSSLPWAWINLGLAGAASTAFALTLALYLGQPSGSERLDEEIVASHFRSLMPEHLADVASSDQHTVKPWFNGRLDFSPPVLDLAPQGFALVGGRLDYVNHRPVAALAYRHRKHILNLYVWPQRDAPDSAPRPSSRQGFQLLHWSRDGMRYTAVSDIGQQDLMQFAQLLATHAGNEQR